MDQIAEKQKFCTLTLIIFQIKYSTKWMYIREIEIYGIQSYLNSTTSLFQSWKYYIIFVFGVERFLVKIMQIKKNYNLLSISNDAWGRAIAIAFSIDK